MKYLIPALLFSIVLLFATTIFASDHKCHNCMPMNGMDGKDGIDGINGRDGSNGIDGRNGVNGINGKDAPYPSNNINLSRGIAVAGALSQIPALSHVGKHKHTGFGASAATYESQNGSYNAIAAGLLHQENNRSYKATVGFSGSERIIGGGASFAFQL